MRILATSAVALTALLIAACGTTEDTTEPAAPASSAPSGPVDLTDERGTVHLDAPAKNVVSLEWGLTENLVALGVKPVGVPFNGTGPAMNALVAGQVDYMCDQIVNAVPQIKGGTIKAYAVATPERNPSLPDLPTTTEAGLPAYQASAWNAVFAPKGTSPAITAKLNAAAAKALDDENVRKRLLDLGSDIPKPEGRSQAALATLVKGEVEKWSAVLKPATN